MYYLGELARKSYARQEVLGSNPAGCKKIFSVRDGTRLLSLKPCPGAKIGTKASLKPGQKAESVVVVYIYRPTQLIISLRNLVAQL